MSFLSIVNANLIEKNGKKLYINDFSGKKDDLLIISREYKSIKTIKNTIRITIPAISNSMNLRKFLPILERNVISVGSFAIEADFSIKPNVFNPIIDNKIYFLSEIPELNILDYSKMTLLCDTSQPFENEKKIFDFIKKSKFSEIILSGKKADFYLKNIGKFTKKITILNNENDIQTSLF